MPSFKETIALTTNDAGGLLITANSPQGKNLLECDDASANMLCAIDSLGNLTWPSNGSTIATVFESSRHLMAAGRYTPKVSGTTPGNYGGPDDVAMTHNSDISIVQSGRAAMWQFHSTDVQNGPDQVVHNVNVVQRFNSLATTNPAQGVVVTQHGTGYPSMPPAPLVTIFQGGTGAHATITALTLNGAISAVTVTAHGSGYYLPPLISFQSAAGLGASAIGLLSVIPGSPPMNGVNILIGGSGYNQATTTVSFAAPQTTAQASVTLSGGQVSSISVGNPGCGYLATPNVTISAPPMGGTQATATASIFAGGVIKITITNPGSGYTGVPLVQIDPPLSRATASALISGGQVMGVQLIKAGAGYLTAPGVTIDQSPNGTRATAMAYIDSSGAVVQVVIVNPASGYTSPPNVTINAPMGGRTAQGTPIVSGGQVTGVNVTDSGSGYLSPPLITFSDSGMNPGSGAYAIPVMQLDSIVVQSGGSGYTSTDTVMITGNGDGTATATATVANGAVSGVTVITAGASFVTPPPVWIAPSPAALGIPALAMSALQVIGRTGIEIDTYTQPGNGGDVSGALFVQAGGGNAFTAYKMSETGRLPSLDNYAFSMGMAIECATADPWYAVEVGAGGFGSPHAGGCIMLRLGNPGCKGLLVTPEDGVFDGRVAYAIGNPRMGQPDTGLTYWVQLNGNISTLGQLAVGGPAGLVSTATQATILATADNFTGLVVRAHSATYSANLQEWQDATGTRMGSIGQKGAVTGYMDVVASSGTIMLDVSKGTLHTTTVTTGGSATVSASGPGNAAQEMTVLIINMASSLSVTFTDVTHGNYFHTAGPVNFNTANTAAVLRFVSDSNAWYEVTRSQYALT
jgi:hypothetical protein